MKEKNDSNKNRKNKNSFKILNGKKKNEYRKEAWK